MTLSNSINEEEEEEEEEKPQSIKRQGTGESKEEKEDNKKKTETGQAYLVYSGALLGRDCLVSVFNYTITFNMLPLIKVFECLWEHWMYIP
jgi:hypothetical protein